MARGEWRTIDDLFILVGLGLVGFMAYKEWYDGKSIEEVAQDVDQKVRSFLDSIQWPKLPLPQFPQPQMQQPQITYQQQTQQPQQQISTNPTTNNTIPETALPETPQAPTGPGVSIIGIAGDWQSASPASAVAQAMEKNGVQFVILNGDYNGGNVQSLFGKNFQGRMVGSKGNHDSGSDYSMFGQSSWNTATKINPTVGVVTMDNNGISEQELDGLASKLRSQGCKIIIFSMHMPCVTAGGDHHKASENKNCPAIESVAQKYGVQLLVNGHNHYYGRANKNGRTYVTVGTAGGDFRSGDGSGGGLVKVVTGKNGFLKCTTQGNSLNCQFVSTSNEVLDSFSITGSVATQSAYLYATPYIEQYIPRMRNIRPAYAVFR